MSVRGINNKTNKQIEPVALDSTDYICTTGLDEKDIEKAKQRLIRKHIKDALKGLRYSLSEQEMIIPTSRLYFVQIESRIILCGVYKVNEIFDAIDEHRTHISHTYDYLLFSQTSGFFMLKGCSGPLCKPESSLPTSPSIYFQSDELASFTPIEYGVTYRSQEIFSIQIKYNVRTYQKNDYYAFHVIAFLNTEIIFDVKDATMFCELPLVPGWLVYTDKQRSSKWFVSAKLSNYTDGKVFSLLIRGWNNSQYDFYSSLSTVMACLDIQEFRTSDNENYYFYVSNTDALAFEKILQCANAVGNFQRINNLLSYDPTLNVQITIPKKDYQDVAEYIFGIINNSKNVFPSILGCPIHDVMEVLCNDCKKNPYVLPTHSDDLLSAENVIYLIKKEYGEMPNWEIVNLIVSQYGSYAAEPLHFKYWHYYHGEGLREGFLRTPIANRSGQEIKDRVKTECGNSQLPSKWKSEESLYALVYLYYQDALSHYNAKWLGQQHLDIFIPCLRIGIEYQGKQHYEAVEFFGGEQGLIDRQILDEKKRMLCIDNGITLIEWPFSMPINAANLVKILTSYDVVIPTPDPLRKPTQPNDNVQETKNTFSICQYSIEGQFEKAFNNSKEASQLTGISKKAIEKAVYGYSKTAGGYQWRKVNSELEYNNIEPLGAFTSKGVSRSVYQVSLDGEIIAEYPSISKAAKAAGTNSKSIICVLNGVQKTAGNYYWVYKED